MEDVAQAELSSKPGSTVPPPPNPPAAPPLPPVTAPPPPPFDDPFPSPPQAAGAAQVRSAIATPAVLESAHRRPFVLVMGR